MNKQILKVGILVSILVVPAFLFLMAHVLGENRFDLPKNIPVGLDERIENGVLKYDTVYHSLGQFTLTNELNDEFNSSTLKGKITVVSFIFTSCPKECKEITANLIKVHSVFDQEDDVQLVSITVDPKHDRPEVLSRYKSIYEIEGDNWVFLTSDDKNYLYNIIKTQFFLGVEEGYNDTFTHSDKVVLLDKEGVNRGFYTGTDVQSIDELISGIEVLKRNYE